MSPLNGIVDDRIGLLTAKQYEELKAETLDVTPTVLLVDGPREGVLAGLAGAEQGLPLKPATRRVLGVPVPKRSGDPVITTTKTSGKDVRAACAGLSRRAAGEFMDRGIWVLYLGVGMLHWSDPADGRAESQDSPLLLVPVRLEAGKGGTSWKLLPTEEESLVEPGAVAQARARPRASGCPSWTPRSRWKWQPLLAAVREAVAEHPQWAVEERVVLVDASPSTRRRCTATCATTSSGSPRTRSSARWPRGPRRGGAVRLRAGRRGGFDDAFPPEEAVTILDADASQRQCIAAAREGRSFVMDGPPGTGKSQTIANMIAELIAHGKTVLFVSEKAAALDVVHNRLAHVELDEYVLELHSHKTTRSAVATALGASLLRRPKPNPALTAHDLDEAQRRRDALSRYARTLNEPRRRARRPQPAPPARRDRDAAASPPGAGRDRGARRPRGARAGRAAAGDVGGRRTRRRLRVARRGRDRVDAAIGQRVRDVWRRSRPGWPSCAARPRRSARTCCSSPPRGRRRRGR